MPVSRISFALADVVREIKGLPGVEGRDAARVDLMLDVETYEQVVRELEYHHGAKLKRLDDYRGQGVRYAGCRILMIPPGNGH